MRSRKYTKVIEIWQTSDAVDEYGGNIASSDTLIAKSWCNIKTPKMYNSNSLSDIGITDPVNSIIIKLRHRNDITYNAINQYIKYNGFKYIIQNNPRNVDLEGVDVEIVATREQADSVTEINPVGSKTFDNTFDLTFN